MSLVCLLFSKPNILPLLARGEIFSHYVYVRVFNLMSCHLRLPLGRAPQCIYIIGTKKRAQMRPCTQFNILTIGAMGRTLAQPQANLSLLRSNT
jgi:hypothetical protein